MNQVPSVSPFAAGVKLRCPRCGEGALFRKFISLNDACAVCDLEFAQADSGDGPAVFVIFIVGFLAVALAFIARFSWQMPMWAAFITSAGFTLVAVLVLLPPMKATIIALQFAKKAAEARNKR